MAARETAQALKTLAQAARGVAASTSDPAAAHAMLDSARDVMEGSAMLIQEAKQALIAPGDAESQQRLAQVRPEPALWPPLKGHAGRPPPGHFSSGVTTSAQDLPKCRSSAGHTYIIPTFGSPAQ